MAATLEQRRKQRFQFLRCLYEMSRGSERVLVYVNEVGDAIGLGEMEAQAAAQYLGEKGLIRVVMGHIISISLAGADELETALEQPDQATAHFPPAQSVVWTPINAQPTITKDITAKPPITEEPIRPLPAHIVQNDSDELAATELKAICEAIGLDPKEITGELGPHHGPVPEFVHKRNPEPVFDSVTPEYQEHEPGDARSHIGNKADLHVILESLGQQLSKLRLAPDELAEVQAEIDTALAQLASPRPKPHIVAASLRTLLSVVENAGPPLTSDTRENLVAIRFFQERLSA
jgi:hypothetical protein